MDFYVSWYPGDPHYPLYDPACRLLISVSSVSSAWNLKRLRQLPIRLLIDSGGYRYASSPQEALSPRSVFEKQISMIGEIEIPTIICARDFPILSSDLNSNQKDELITRTIAYAYELQNLVDRKNLPDYIKPMAIVQGYDEDSVFYCASELRAIGFKLYGVGSLAELRHPRRIIKRLNTVASVVGAESIHVFGVSAIETVLAMRDLGIQSVDSARPAKSAAYNELIYSQPFRRFGIIENPSGDGVIRGKLPLNRRLAKPLPCNCPICIKNPFLILGVGKRVFIRSRAVHNYYHLKKVCCD
jgi:7-cyano-7-deazaguanine tRNA-ribosyltransferase